MTDTNPAAGGLSEAVRRQINAGLDDFRMGRASNDALTERMVETVLPYLSLPAVEDVLDNWKAQIEDTSGATVVIDLEDAYEQLHEAIAARTEAAEREVARVTAAVEALESHEVINPGGLREEVVTMADLRAALSSADTTLDDLLDRERAKAWDEGVRYAWDDPEPYDLRHNPYRAAAVSPEGGGA